MREILKRAGAPLGNQLRGKALASYVLAKAHDGYQVVFTLGEMDAAFGNEQILVADKRDGKPLFGYQGPFRLVCPNDKAGARSVRMLETLEVVRLAEVRELSQCWMTSLGFCDSGQSVAHLRGAPRSDYQWNLPKGFPKPYVPADNPMTAAKVELGRYLFYDTRMSVNGKASCATCHKQELAFTDGRAVGRGRHRRIALAQRDEPGERGL